MDEFGHRNEINDVEQSASHPKNHEVSNDVAERNNSELDDPSQKNDSGKIEKGQNTQRDNSKIDSADKQPENSELQEPEDSSKHPTPNEIENAKRALPEGDIHSDGAEKSKQEHIPEYNSNSEPLPDVKDNKSDYVKHSDELEGRKGMLDNHQEKEKENESEKPSAQKDIPVQTSELPDSTETTDDDSERNHVKENKAPEDEKSEDDSNIPKNTSELNDALNENSDNNHDVTEKAKDNDAELDNYRKPETDSPLSEPEDNEKTSLKEDKNYPDDLSDDELKQLDESTAPNELIDTTNDKVHPYVDEEDNEKTWRENQSPFVNQEDSNGKYNPDAWGQEDIPKGTKLYQITGEDGKQSPYYFDEDTASKCRDKDGKIDPTAVKNYLQIDDPNNSKNTIREYYVPEDMKNVPEGRTTENPQYGEGGGKQYYIASQDDRNKLEPILNENPEFKKLKDEYFSDLKDKSDFPNTINDNIKNNNWEKISPELNAEKRKDFANAKNDLIDDWERLNDTKWPTYDDDVFSNSGKCIRHKGDRYDAHHIQPLTFGGENEPQNITPLHAHDHFDKQGVHSPSSPFGKMSQFD